MSMRRFDLPQIVLAAAIAGASNDPGRITVQSPWSLGEPIDIHRDGG